MDKKKKLTLIISVALVSIVLLIGVTYALNYTQTGTNQELILGDIYMRYNEISGLSIEDSVPGSNYSNYFEFTISGKNTYTKKDIYYDFILNRGDLPTNKTEENRIPDKYLKFKLVSVDDSGVETEIFADKLYDSLSNKRIHVEIIAKNTEEVNRTYRLYMTIDNSLLIGNTSDAIFTFSEFENAFASVKLHVTGDFTEKEVEKPAGQKIIASAVNKESTSSCKTYVEEDGITYISGTKNCIDFNYVWYSGKLWRITAIYPDGTMKMITDSAITTIAYGTDYNFYTDESTSSWIYQWLNEDFLDTLYNYENIIVTDATWNVTSGNGTISTKLAETTMVPAKVGLLNSYEYYMSYKNTSYGNGYLNIGYYWWLLNPYNSASSSYVWSVSSSGYASSSYPSSSTFGSRPVVNLQSTIQLSGGTGIKTDPYRIKGDKEEVIPNTTLLNTRSSGEYVNFDGELYRIVGIENGITKINKVDYIRDDTDTIITKYLASSATFGKDTNTQNEDYWDYYLNNTWYNSISSNYKSMLETGTYYLGRVASPYSYKKAICATASNTVSTKDCEKTTSTWSGYVGLSRYGEMFSSQQGSGYSSSSNMWLITPYGSSLIWGVTYGGFADNIGTPSSDTNGSRPSLNLKSIIKITDGYGTESSPYEISL